MKANFLQSGPAFVGGSYSRKQRRRAVAPHLSTWLVILAWLLCNLTPAFGAALSWDGGSALNNKWSTAANWNPNGVPQNGDTLRFPIELGVHHSDNDLTGLSLAGITIQTEAEITGNAITLTGDFVVEKAPVTFSPDITAGDGFWITRMPFGGTLTLASDLNLNGHTVRFNPGVAEIVCSGRVSGNGTLILGNLTDGHIRLTGNLANTYTGETFVYGKTTLERTTGPALLNSVTVAGGPLELLTTGQIQGNQPLDLAGGTTLKLNNFSVSVSLLKLDDSIIESTIGLLTLNGNATVSGNATLECDVTLPTGGHTFDIFANASLTLEGDVNGTGSLIKNGAGTLTLAPGNHTYGGVTTVNAGQLVLQNCDPGGSAFGTVVNNTGQVVLDNALISSEALTLSTTHNPTNVAALKSLGVSEWNGPITLSQNCALEGGGDLRVAALIGGGGDLHLRGNIIRLGGFNGTNTFTGKTWVHAANAILQAGSATRILLPGAVEVSTGGTLRWNGDNQLKSATSLTVAEGGVADFDGNDDTLANLTLGGELNTDGGLLTLNGGITVPTSSESAQLKGRVTLPAGEHAIAVNGTTSELLVSAELLGAGSLRKTGSGELRLAALNFYSGATWLDAGSTALDSGASFGAIGGGVFLSSDLHLNNGIILAEPLTLFTNASLRLAAGTNLWAAPVTNLGSCNLHVATNAALLFSGAIHGNGTFRGDSASQGMVSFFGSATNGFNGEIRFASGLLMLNKSNAPVFAADGTLQLNNNAVARFGADNQFPDNLKVELYTDSLLDLNGYRDRITDLELLGGDLTTGSGLLELAGDITYPSTTTGTPSTIGGQILLTNGTPTIQIGVNGVVQIDARISGPHGIYKNGQGYLSLTGSNSFTGTLDVISGVLFASHASALGTTNGETHIGSTGVLELWGGNNFGAEPITLNSSGDGEFPGLVSGGGTNRLDGNITLSRTIGVKVFPGQLLRLNGAISGNGGVQKEDTGTLTLAGTEANTYTGETVVNRGTLRLAKDAANGTVPGNLIIGNASATALVVASGVEQIADSAQVTINANSTLDISTTSGGERFSRLLGGGHILLGNRDLRVMNGALASTFAGDIAGTGGLIKEGNARLRLTGTNTYTGPTDINAGSLQVNGSVLASHLRVNSGGTLGGNGTVGQVTAFSGGTVAPGESPGRLTVTGNLTLRNGSTLAVEINGSAPGTDFDQITAQAGVAITNANLTVALHFTPTNGQRFRLIDKTSGGDVAGTFNALPQDATLSVGDTTFSANYLTGTGNDFTLVTTDVPTTPPPPATPVVFTAITRLGNGNVRLDGTGQTNQPIMIEFTENFEDWNDLGSRPVNDGTFTIQDASPVSPRFYRARLQ